MEWKEVRLESILALPSRNGLTKPSKIRGKGVKMIGMGELFANPIIYDIPMDRVPVTDKELSNSRIMPGDLLFARQSLTLEGAGKCCYVKEVKEETVFESHLIRIRIDKTKADAEFIYYFFNSFIGKCLIQNLVTQVAAAGIRGSELVKLDITIPKEVEDQRRIASILSSLDRKIELNNKINADLEEMAQAIFKNWFVDFEPFKDGKFVDSELGMIPEGWKVGSLGDFCNVFTGKKNTNQAIEKGLYPFFSCAPEPLASNDAIFNGKAIIIAGNGSYTGRTSFYNGGFDLYQRTYACTIREQDKENLMIFFYHMMKQFFEPTKMGGTRGSSIPYIVMGDITQQKFPYSKDWLIRFSNIANSMMDRKLRLDKENSRLSLLRDTLLPRLMSGELEVQE